MTEAFRTDTTFGVNDQITAKLREIIASLRGVDRVAKSVQETLNKLNMGNFKMPNAAQFRTAGENAGKAYGSGFASGAAAGVRAGASAAANAMRQAAIAGPGGSSGGSLAVASQWAQRAIQTGGAGTAMAMAGGGGGWTATPRGSMGGLVPSGIPLNFGGVFGGGGAPPGGAGGGSGGRGGLGSLAGGAVLQHYGVDLLDRLGHVAKAGMNYDSEVQQLSNSGYTKAEIDRTVKAAWATSAAVPTSAPTENVKVANELRYALGSADHALNALTAVQQMTAVLQSVTGGKMGASEAYNAARYLEMTNRASNPEQFNSGLDSMSRVVIASRGKVNPTSMLGFAQQAGSQYTGGMEDEARYAVMPRVIQEMGGMRAGTGYAAIMRELVGGVISNRSAAGLEGLGILNPKDMVGKGVQLHAKAGAIPNTDLLLSDAYEWVQKYVAPKLVGMTTAKMSETIAHAFGTGPAQREIAIMAMQGRVLRPGRDADGIANSPIERDREIYHTIKSGTYEQLLKSNPNVALMAFDTQWEAFTTALGHSIIPIIVPGLRAMTSVLTAFSAWAMANPGLAKDIIVFVAALGVTAVVLGTLGIAIGLFTLVVGALTSPIALAVAGITFLGTALLAGILSAHSFGEGVWNVVKAVGALVAGAYLIRAVTGINMLAGALRILSGAATGAVTLATDFAMLAVGIGKLLGPIGAFVAIINGGALNGHESEELTKLRKEGKLPPLRNAPGLTINPDGTIHDSGVPSSTHVAGRHPVVYHVTVTLDGRAVGKASIKHAAREINRPSGGASGYDGTLGQTRPDQRT